jgi:hypothetical protein
VIPSIQPSSSPSSHPSSFPSYQPTIQPSCKPTIQPTSYPSSQPSNKPTDQPTNFPSVQPSTQPSTQPTSFPTSQPSCRPTSLPSTQPTYQPSGQPSVIPSSQPTIIPTNQPTSSPTMQPISLPTTTPSTQPTCKPTSQPSLIPSNQPTVVPSNQPTSSPTNQPVALPTSIPSAQPSNFPSVQPVSSPTAQPSSQPAMIPTTQPSAFPTSAPVATIYQTNGVIFLLGDTSDSTRNHDDILGTSYILFGRNFNHQSRFPFTIDLRSSSSREFVSEISKNDGGIQNDVTTRSTTIIGDINGDSYLDLLVGYPFASKCSVYLGNGVDDFSTIIATTGESFAIVGDPYDGGGFLGWSSIRIGDFNGDGLDEIIVSAISANTVYVIYGKRNVDKNLKVNDLRSTDGFKIIGHPNEINFGVSLTLLHDFRKGSSADIAITSQTASGGQNIIYILFGAVVFKALVDVKIQQIINNSSACFKIIAPPFSYAGFSIAGIGDINRDGFDDLAIGSVPYSRGKYTEQLTYIIYGRSFTTNSINELQLTKMTTEDGFIITGGGFLVTGVGDVNYDSVNDMMITAYYGWKGKSGAYLITSPPNMTYSPSLQPSSNPTSMINTYPSSSNISAGNNNFSTNSSTIYRPTFRSTRVPSLRPNSGLSVEPTRSDFVVGTARPSQATSSLVPTLSPTKTGYHRLRGFSTPPSLMPTINTTDYSEIHCVDSGDYYGSNDTNFKFIISANQGAVNILGNDDGKATNLYVLYCPTDQVKVVIKNFRLSTDIISVAHLSEAGFSYFSIKDILYSFKFGQLTLFFCESNKLQIVLTTHSSFKLQESNFLFTPKVNGYQLHNDKDSVLAQVKVFIVFIALGLFGWILYLNRVDKNTSESVSYVSGEEDEIITEPASDAHVSDDNHSSSSNSVSDILVSQFASSSDSSDDKTAHDFTNSYHVPLIGGEVRTESERTVSFGSTFMALLNNDSDVEEVLGDGSINSFESVSYVIFSESASDVQIKRPTDDNHSLSSNSVSDVLVSQRSSSSESSDVSSSEGSVSFGSSFMALLNEDCDVLDGSSINSSELVLSDEENTFRDVS